MNVFHAVKAAVSLRQAAEHYGLRVGRNGMTCCPFHEDGHPSLKLNEDYFFCFGCGAKGDVVDLTARLFDLSPKDAARKLAGDFGISAEAGPVPLRRRNLPSDEERCRRALTDYLHLQQRLVRAYAPKTPSRSFCAKFVVACQQRERAMGMLEMLDYACQPERAQTAAALVADGTVAAWERAVAQAGKEGESHGSESA